MTTYAYLSACLVMSSLSLAMDPQGTNSTLSTNEPHVQPTIVAAVARREAQGRNAPESVPSVAHAPAPIMTTHQKFWAANPGYVREYDGDSKYSSGYKFEPPYEYTGPYGKPFVYKKKSY